MEALGAFQSQSSEGGMTRASSKGGGFIVHAFSAGPPGAEAVMNELWTWR